MKKILRLIDHRVGHISVTDGVISSLEKEFYFDIVDLIDKFKITKKLMLYMEGKSNIMNFLNTLKRNELKSF